MTGSSAAALTGLMFIVITLVTGTQRRRSTSDGLSTFSTPTVVHFSAALLISAALCAPWRSLVHPGVVLGLTGICGVVYAVRLMRRTSRLSVYTPDVEDWAWYTILPLVAYCAVLGGAIVLPFAPVNALFAIGGGVGVLIFVGIRNSWDIVTYIAVQEADTPPPPAQNDEAR